MYAWNFYNFSQFFAAFHKLTLKLLYLKLIPHGTSQLTCYTVTLYYFIINRTQSLNIAKGSTNHSVKPHAMCLILHEKITKLHLSNNDQNKS